MRSSFKLSMADRRLITISAPTMTEVTGHILCYDTAAFADF